MSCKGHARIIQHNVGRVNNILLDAAQLIVGHHPAMEDEPTTAVESRLRFSAALKKARIRYGTESGQGLITQKQFAKTLGISGERPEERYRLYESGEREPPLWILSAIRRVTGHSLDDLIAQMPPGRRVDRSSKGV